MIATECHPCYRRRLFFAFFAAASLWTTVSASSSYSTFSFGSCINSCLASNGCSGSNTSCVCTEADENDDFLSDSVVCLAKNCLLASGESVTAAIDAVDVSFISIVVDVCDIDGFDISESQISSALAAASSIISELFSSTVTTTVTKTEQHKTAARTADTTASSHHSSSTSTSTSSTTTSKATTSRSSETSSAISSSARLSTSSFRSARSSTAETSETSATSAIISEPDASLSTETTSSTGTISTPLTTAQSTTGTAKTTRTSTSTAAHKTPNNDPFDNANAAPGGRTPWQTMIIAVVPMVIAAGLWLR